MNLRFDGYFFDLDGVIFDTEPLYTHYWEHIGKTYHPEIDNFSHIIKGQTLTEIFDLYFSADLLKVRQNIVDDINTLEATMPFNYIKGFEHFIQKLKQSGARTAIVTSSNIPKMLSVYQQHQELKEYFDVILTAEDFKESKPSPYGYLKAAELLKVDARKSVGFEDSFNGLKSVKSAKMHVVGLATTNTAESIQIYCHEIIKDFTDLTWL